MLKEIGKQALLCGHLLNKKWSIYMRYKICNNTL